MNKIPEKKHYTQDQLHKKVKLFKWLAARSTKANGKNLKTIGKEFLLETSEGTIRVLGYNFDKEDVMPLFVNIHGGGFILGDAEMDDPYMPNLAIEANVKILNISYSLAPENPFPKALEESYAVVKYAQDHADELAIDPHSIAVGGHSAGGNLSAAICIKNARSKALNIKGLILDYPPLDLYTDPYLKPHPKGALPRKISRLFDACYHNSKEGRKNPLISPIYADNEQLDSFPPTLMITASMDSLCNEAEKFKDRLLEVGVSVTHKRFDGSRHGFTLSEKPDAKEAWNMMADHLKACLHQT